MTALSLRNKISWSAKLDSRSELVHLSDMRAVSVSLACYVSVVSGFRLGLNPS